jgi:hypothetical protein
MALTEAATISSGGIAADRVTLIVATRVKPSVED